MSLVSELRLQGRAWTIAYVRELGVVALRWLQVREAAVALRQRELVRQADETRVELRRLQDALYEVVDTWLGGQDGRGDLGALPAAAPAALPAALKLLGLLSVAALLAYLTRAYETVRLAELQLEQHVLEHPEAAAELAKLRSRGPMQVLGEALVAVALTGAAVAVLLRLLARRERGNAT